MQTLVEVMSDLTVAETRLARKVVVRLVPLAAMLRDEGRGGEDGRCASLLQTLLLLEAKTEER